MMNEGNVMNFEFEMFDRKNDFESIFGDGVAIVYPAWQYAWASKSYSYMLIF